MDGSLERSGERYTLGFERHLSHSPAKALFVTASTSNVVEICLSVFMSVSRVGARPQGGKVSEGADGRRGD